MQGRIRHSTPAIQYAEFQLYAVYQETRSRHRTAYARIPPRIRATTCAFADHTDGTRGYRPYAECGHGSPRYATVRTHGHTGHADRVRAVARGYGSRGRAYRALRARNDARARTRGRRAERHATHGLPLMRSRITDYAHTRAYGVGITLARTHGCRHTAHTSYATMRGWIHAGIPDSTRSDDGTRWIDRTADTHGICGDTDQTHARYARIRCYAFTLTHARLRWRAWIARIARARIPVRVRTDTERSRGR